LSNPAYRLLVILGCAAALAACQKPAARPAPSAAPATADEAASAYIVPPELKAAQHSAAGGVELRGTSRPDAQIRLLTSDGGMLSAVADHSGYWEMRAPSVDPRLFALAEETGGRLVRSRGFIAILPAPGIPALVLRPGAGPHAFGSAHSQPVIGAVDFDRGGAGVVSGLAAPGQALRVQVDGAEVGEGRSDAAGYFSISLAEMLKPGAHTAVVRAVNDQGQLGQPAQASFEVGPASMPLTPPLTAQRLEGGWRIDWVTPGGGVQTTIAFDTEPRA